MQHIVIVFSDAFDELGMEGLRLFLQVGGNLFHFILGAHGFIVPVDGFHIDEIDDAFEGCFLSDWNLDGNRAGIETFADGIDGMFKVGAHLVHLVDEANSRNTVFVSLAPHGFGLRLNPVNSIEYSASAVEHAQ